MRGAKILSEYTSMSLTYRFLLGAFLGSLLLNGYLAHQTQQQQEKIIFNCPALNEDAGDPLWVSRNKASGTHHRMQAKQLASLIGNIDEHNVESTLEYIGTAFKGAKYVEIEDALRQKVGALKNGGVEVTWEYIDTSFDPNTGYVYVKGREKRTVSRYFKDRSNNKPIENTERLFSFEFKFKYLNWLPYVAHFDMYEGEPAYKSINQVKESEGTEHEAK